MADNTRSSKRRMLIGLRNWLGAAYRVIRFWNGDVIENLPGIIEVIRRELGQA